MDSSRVLGEVPISSLFDQFIEAQTMRNVLSIHHRIMNYADINPGEFNVFFPKLKRAVLSNKERKNWKAKALFSKIDKKAGHRCYSNTKTSTLLGNKSGDTQASQEHLDDSISSQSGRTFHTNNALQHYNCLVIGSGPAGLRTAIELQLLGASRVVIVEKRSRFSRNNVLHLWPFVIDDLKSLGAKKFYGKFCAGSIDHISIRQLQLILLKICLMIGCDFRDSCSYLYLCPDSLRQTKQIAIDVDCDNEKSADTKNEPQQRCALSQEKSNPTCFTKCNANQATESQYDLDTESRIENNENSLHGDSRRDSLVTSMNKITERSENLRGARAHFQSEYSLQEDELHSHEWDFIIGADGRRNTLSKFFPRKEFRGRLAIAITANFINRQTPTEAAIPEISGLSFIYNQDMFNALSYDTNIHLENICYYKDDTHYFVMTAKKKSLLERGVLLQDYATTQDLLSDNNVNKEALLKYAKDAAFWTTGLEPLDFALNHYGQEDCAMFDFTSMYAASNACKALRTKEGGLTLVNLVGDSLLEPFWPTGSGCARGFLSSFDAAWMCRQWAVNRCAVLDHHGSVSSRSSRNRNSNISESSKIAIGGEKKSTYNRMALSVMAERESIYRVLAQTKSENLQQNYSHWTLNPHTRYPNLNRYLVTPGQCEHLITDFETKIDLSKLPTPNGQRTWRVKSPNNASHRKSPKKLKSANASPQMQAKNRQNRAKSLSKSHNPKTRGRQESSLDDTYLEFERSYNNLADDDRHSNQYICYQQRNGYDPQDDLFIPSISGTMPSSNNLLSLEARRARDIDDCLRQRRQKSQIGAVKDHLMLQLRKNSFDQQRSDSVDSDRKPIIRGNAALFSELRRLREQQATGKENIKRDIAGPLTLFNSMRRCASFAERVKSFESKLSQPSSGQESTVTTPRTPTDNVKNLPEFATLQELFVRNSRDSQDRDGPKKAKMPIMKLSKDDWNVKCWEKRLAAYKQRIGDREMSSSTRSLNKSISVDGYRTLQPTKSEKQVEVFKDRIKEMAEKLEKAKEPGKRPVSSALRSQRSVDVVQTNERPRSWVNHLKQELTKGSKPGVRPVHAPKPAMNPSLPSKPIKKLFADDEDDDDGIDVNKHYDHLCVNKPSNRVFSKNNYTSHLRRTKFDSTTSKVVNVKPTAEGKQAYLAAITPRTSSASSTLSDYSTNTGGSSSGCGSNETVSFCARCKTNVRSVDRIRIGKAILHKTCLTCSECGITLRTNEIQYYLDASSAVNKTENESERSAAFSCVICKPEIRSRIVPKSANLETATPPVAVEEAVQQRMKSRAEFMSERINYNEVYKNIFGRETRDESANNSDRKLSRIPSADKSESTGESDGVRRGSQPNDVLAKRPSLSGGYRIARSETIDGSEQVTIVLDPEIGDSEDAAYECREPGQREMIDEDELNKILHIDDSSKDKTSSRSLGGSASDDTSEGDGDSDADQNGQNDAQAELSDDPSSLNSAPDSDEYENENDDDDDDDEDDIEPTNGDRNSTYDDFLTSEEFGSTSDKEDEAKAHEAKQTTAPAQKGLPVSSG